MQFKATTIERHVSVAFTCSEQEAAFLLADLDWFLLEHGDEVEDYSTVTHELREAIDAALRPADFLADEDDEIGGVPA